HLGALRQIDRTALTSNAATFSMPARAERASAGVVPMDPQNASIPPPSVETVILPRAHDIGGFEVRRALPARERQMVGPFIFFDQMGPGEFLSGKGLGGGPITAERGIAHSERTDPGLRAGPEGARLLLLGAAYTIAHTSPKAG